MSSLNTQTRIAKKARQIPEVEEVPCPADVTTDKNSRKKNRNHSLKASPNAKFNCIYCRRSWADIDADFRQ